jgi:DNA-binding NarL/FixJ family response regulator
METTPFRLVIIADDPLARAGLAALLNNEAPGLVIGQLSSQVDLKAELAVYQPDVLLWDLGWASSTAVERLAELPDLELPTVILLPDAEQVSQAWASGAQGLLPREAEGGQLLAALRAARQGLVILDPALADSLLPAPSLDPPTLTEALTPREEEVLQLLAEGLPNKTIARRLEISEHTVKFHVAAIMGKVGARSRTEAVVRATQLGLIWL